MIDVRVPAVLLMGVSAVPSIPAFGLAWPNPLALQRADPCINRHTDSFYYFTATVPEYDRVELRQARHLDDLAAAAPMAVWHQDAPGVMGNHIWVPELYFLDGRWYVYFAAGSTQDQRAIRMYVPTCAAANPLDGPWQELGQIKTPWESFALDATIFDHAQVNDGPAVPVRNGRVFATYSASATDSHYCMGMLTADENADLLGAKSWHKSPHPVFATSVAHAIYGPGHNSFTTAEDGSDLLVFHARDYRDIVGDPLNDPNRHTRVQKFTWAADGTPVFGEPEAKRPR